MKRFHKASLCESNCVAKCSKNAWTSTTVGNTMFLKKYLKNQEMSSINKTQNVIYFIQLKHTQNRYKFIDRIDSPGKAELGLRMFPCFPCETNYSKASFCIYKVCLYLSNLWSVSTKLFLIFPINLWYLSCFRRDRLCKKHFVPTNQPCNDFAPSWRKTSPTPWYDKPCNMLRDQPVASRVIFPATRASCSRRWCTQFVLLSNDTLSMRAAFQVGENVKISGVEHVRHRRLRMIRAPPYSFKLVGRGMHFTPTLIRKFLRQVYIPLFSLWILLQQRIFAEIVVREVLLR